MELGSVLNKCFTFVLACRHGSTRVVEGKTFCPDCGVGVVYEWVILKCKGCRQKRAARYWFNQVVPYQSCCSMCGEVACIEETHASLQFYQLSHALLIKTIEEEENYDYVSHLSEWFRRSTLHFKTC
jgi:hypothetical protein